MPLDSTPVPQAKPQSNDIGYSEISQPMPMPKPKSKPEGSARKLAPPDSPPGELPTSASSPGFDQSVNPIRGQGTAHASNLPGSGQVGGVDSVTVHGDCPNFRGGDDVALKEELCRRENGTVPFGPSRQDSAARAVQAAYVEPAEPKSEEPAKLRTKPSPLEIPPDLPGADAPPIHVPPFGAPRAERTSAIERIYRELPEMAKSALAEPQPGRTPLSLTELQQIAMCRSPLVRQAASDVEAARGAMIQARVFSNPHVGYEGDTINTGSTAGYQGINLQQQIPTGGKRLLNVAAAEMDLRNAELALRAARYDLATQVRNNYFAVLVAVENVKVSRALAELAENSYRIQIGRVRAAEAAPYEPLLLRVQAVQNRASLVQAQQAHAAAWRKLVAVLNWPELPLTPLVGSVNAPAPQISYQAALDRLLTCHTSLAVARNTIEKTRYQLEVARRTPVIPNVDVSAVLQHDYTTPPFNTVWSLNVGAPLPVWDQNRGNIMAAEAALIRASADVDRAANDLRNQLADAYNNYVTNEVTLKYYRTDMIVDQVRAYRALYQRYQEDPDRVDFVGDIVQQQQVLATLITSYVQTLGSRWQSIVTLAGLLQEDDLWQMGASLPREAISAPKPPEDVEPIPPPPPLR